MAASRQFTAECIGKRLNDRNIICFLNPATNRNDDVGSS